MASYTLSGSESKIIIIESCCEHRLKQERIVLRLQISVAGVYYATLAKDCGGFFGFQHHTMLRLKPDPVLQGESHDLFLRNASHELQPEMTDCTPDNMVSGQPSTCLL